MSVWPLEDKSLAGAAVRLSPIPEWKNNGLAALGRAVSADLEGKPAEALAELSTVAAENGESATLSRAMAEIQMSLGQYAEASAQYRKALELDPSDLQAQFGLAVCLEKLGSWDQAAQQFSRVLKADPERHVARLGLALCQLHLDLAEPALANLDAYLNTSPDDPTALFAKAAGLQMACRLDEAAQAYAILLAQDPSSEAALVNLVAIAIACGDTSAIRTYAEQLLAVNPEVDYSARGSRDGGVSGGGLGECGGLL